MALRHIGDRIPVLGTRLHGAVDCGLQELQTLKVLAIRTDSARDIQPDMVHSLKGEFAVIHSQVLIVEVRAVHQSEESVKSTASDVKGAVSLEGSWVSRLRELRVLEQVDVVSRKSENRTPGDQQARPKAVSLFSVGMILSPGAYLSFQQVSPIDSLQRESADVNVLSNHWVNDCLQIVAGICPRIHEAGTKHRRYIGHHSRMNEEPMVPGQLDQEITILKLQTWQCGFGRATANLLWARDVEITVLTRHQSGGLRLVPAAWHLRAAGCEGGG